jgi:hypothetical protein
MPFLFAPSDALETVRAPMNDPVVNAHDDSVCRTLGLDDVAVDLVLVAEEDIDAAPRTRHRSVVVITADMARRS